MIPFLDLKAQYQSIKAEIDAAVFRVLESSQFILGAEVARFEEEFAAYSGATHGIGVNTGTSALHLALLAAGVGPGDEVITPAMTFVATAAAILYTGAKPVFVDIHPETYTIDVTKIEASVTPKTKVILPVHLYGQPADMDPILEIAARRNLLVIEDAAQAHGAEYKGKRVGGLGVMGCFSFYPGKNLGAYGEGGMVTTGSEEHAKTIRMLRDWGQEKKYHHKLRGYNYRLEGIQGAVLRVKLKYLEAWTEARRQNAKLYNEGLAGAAVVAPKAAAYARHVYHVYPILYPQRDALAEALQKSHIHTGIHYPTPVHLQEAYSDLGYGVGAFPVAERVAKEILSLPMYPELSGAAIKEVCERIKEETSQR